MEIIVPSYLNAEEALNFLQTKAGFPYQKYWNANVLSMPPLWGDGSLLLYKYEHMHIVRGKWNFKHSTCFDSADLVKTSKHIDFRITADGAIHSAFLQGARFYGRDITMGNEVKFFIQRNCFDSEVRLLDKMEKYNLDRNISMLSRQIFNLESDSTTSLILLESKLLEFTYLWMEFLKKHDMEQYFEGISDNNLRLLLDAKNLIDESLSNPYSIKQLSKKVGLNELYLKDGFRKLTGFTIRQYIIKARMESARDLVLKSDLSMGEICSQLGYSNRGHFSQLYLKYFGVLPYQHRPRENFVLLDVE